MRSRARGAQAGVIGALLSTCHAFVAPGKLHLNNKSVPLPPDVRPEIDRLLARIGYRFVLRRLEHPAKARRATELPLDMTWENIGVAPCYGPYGLAVAVRDSSGRAVPQESGGEPSVWLRRDLEVFPEIGRAHV